MPITISSQAFVFLYTVLGGMVVGFAYDLFRVSRKVIRTKNIVVYLEDIIFWLIVSTIIFGVLFISNAGEIRGYAFLGIILGVIIYALTLSHFVTKLLIKIINLLKKTVIFLYKIISIPIKVLIKILYFPISYICKLCKTIRNLIKKIYDIILYKIKLNIKNIKISSKKF